MPSYVWLLDHEIDTASTAGKIRAMQQLGVPYPDGYAAYANRDLKVQADSIRSSLKSDKISSGGNKEILALIAYLQRMGKDIKASGNAGAENAGQSVMGN